MRGTVRAKQLDPTKSDLPNALAAPARRALAGAGIQRLKQLTAFSEDQVRQFHGLGPSALTQLHRAFDAKGLSFAKSKRENLHKCIKKRFI